MASFQVSYVTEDCSERSGGVPAVVRDLSTRVAPFARKVNILCVREQPFSAPEGTYLRRVPASRYAAAWAWSSDLRDEISRVMPSQPGLVHIHGVWMAPQWMAAQIASRVRVPFILSTHAMLEPWFWQFQKAFHRGKKRLYWLLLAKNVFQHAAVIHAITPLERDNLRKFFPKQQIEVIPNAIDLPEELVKNPIRPPGHEALILFIGRIHPQKGVDLLIRAFAKAALASKWRLAIVGPVFSAEYETELTKLVKDLDLNTSVEFVGPVFGTEKWKWLQRAWVVAVPSRAEVIGLINLESAACGTPTITTFETGLTNWRESGGLQIHATEEDLRTALVEACRWSDAERLQRGSLARQFVETNYSWSKVLPEWLNLYEGLFR